MFAAAVPNECRNIGPFILSRDTHNSGGIIEATELQEVGQVYAFGRHLASGAMAQRSSEIVGWGMLQVNEMDKSTRVVGPHQSADGPVHTEQAAMEKFLVQQVSAHTLLTELKRRADGACMGTWKLSLSSTTIKASPMGLLRHFIQACDSLKATAMPSTMATETKEPYNAAHPIPIVTAEEAESSNNDGMHEVAAFQSANEDGDHDGLTRAGLRFKKLVVQSGIVFIDDI